MSLSHTSAPPRERVTVGPIQVADQAVLAEYCPAERWNGFLCPRLDALTAVTVLTELTALQPTSTAWTFGVDGSLIVINLDYVASGDSVDDCTDTYAPDRDGLYALGAWSWTWQEADSEALRRCQRPPACWPATVPGRPDARPCRSSRTILALRCPLLIGRPVTTKRPNSPTASLGCSPTPWNAGADLVDWVAR